MISTSFVNVLYLALVIQNEASIEPLRCQHEVAEVVLRRVESPYYPNTVRGVVTERFQFSFYKKGKVYTLDSKYMDTATAVIDNWNRGITYTSSELHYAGYDIHRKWMDNMRPTHQCSYHVFYDNGGKR